MLEGIELSEIDTRLIENEAVIAPFTSE
uniref:Uncharacterized protein n=1 Tax=Onchocerca volvulus TaxID=6282 RepID=A0A8R1TLH8_ONCVO